MHTLYESDNRQMSLNVTIACNGSKKFRVWAEDYGKPNSKYADRGIKRYLQLITEFSMKRQFFQYKIKNFMTFKRDINEKIIFDLETYKNDYSYLIKNSFEFVTKYL